MEFAINNTVNRTIKTTPSIALFGLNQKGTNDIMTDYFTNLNTEDRDLTTIRNQIVINNRESQLENKKYFDKKRIQAPKYSVGDIVLIRNIVTEPGINQKLVPEYRGPYVITDIKPGDRYVVEDMPGQQISNRPFKGVMAPFNMKHYKY